MTTPRRSTTTPCWRRSDRSETPCDNALAESFVDSYKTELIADRVWRSRAQVEIATVEWVGWFNHDRLHESIGDIPPVEFEQQYAATSSISGNGSVAGLSPRAPDGLSGRLILPAAALQSANVVQPALPASTTMTAAALSAPHAPPIDGRATGVRLRPPSGRTPPDAGATPAITLQ